VCAQQHTLTHTHANNKQSASLLCLRLVFLFVIISPYIFLGYTMLAYNTHTQERKGGDGYSSISLHRLKVFL
jgi:hypothetical protein